MLVDHDIIPSQARNRETATGVEAMDRTAVILEMLRRRKATTATTSLDVPTAPGVSAGLVLSTSVAASSSRPGRGIRIDGLSARQCRDQGHVGLSPVLALAPADSERQLIVYKGSDTRLPSGRVFGIANGFYDFDDKVPRWTHIGPRSSPCASRLASGWWVTSAHRSISVCP